MILTHCVFEGIDAVGKTTAIERIAEVLRSQGVHVEVVREPYDYAEWMQPVLNCPSEGSESSLFSVWWSSFAYQLARMELFARQFRKWMEWKPTNSSRQMVVVLQDRSFISTMAYQGYALSVRMHQLGLSFDRRSFWRTIAESVSHSMMLPGCVYFLRRDARSEPELAGVQQFYRDALRFLQRVYDIDVRFYPVRFGAIEPYVDKVVRDFLDEYHYLERFFYENSEKSAWGGVSWVPFSGSCYVESGTDSSFVGFEEGEG